MKTIHFLKTAVPSAAVFLCGLLASQTVVAQVQVVESENRLLPSAQPVSAQVPAEPATATAATGPADMFYQLQVLQQELQQLRGLVEEQAYEIKRLKQQRLDDYLSLDRRLSAVGSAQPPANSASSASNTSAPEPAANTSTNSGDERQRYRTAIDLALSKKDYVKAIAAFEQYLADFPQGRYAANSLYWLGEIEMLQGDLEQARQRFTQMLESHKDSNKVPDATYKLGVVYHRLGDDAKAKSLLTGVSQGSSNAAGLAQKYLDENLPAQ